MIKEKNTRKHRVIRRCKNGGGGSKGITIERQCDGAKPACRRYGNRDVRESCHYALHAKTAKERMIWEILRPQQNSEYPEQEKCTLAKKTDMYAHQMAKQGLCETHSLILIYQSSIENQ